ncbi:hypothetical protein H7F33_08740 [Pedobacter sp. PAMC26386]|nr:hypothetical protein H7F33_08740 [Pedobacter sp. PAMC26386]
MKSSFKLTLILCLFLANSCSKDKSVRDDSLTGGKWELSEHLSDTGNGNGEWTAVNKSSRIDHISFKVNGDLDWDLNKEFQTYIIKDSVTLSFIRADKSVQTYAYQIKEGKLSMSPKEPISCIETCGDKYVKTF